MDLAMPNTFDPQKAVQTYREAHAKAERTCDATDQAELARLRQEWADWQGEDSLHEMAFGEPQ